MKKYVLIDASNLFYRARHVSAKSTDEWTKVGFAIHLTLASAHKAVRETKGDHVVFCLERKSWRKSFYAPYKRNRTEARDAMSAEQASEDKLFFQAYDDVCNFFKNKTACTVLQVDNAEADDLIARWISLHPNDEHVIVSSDSDFYQLIAPNVKQFNGITNEWITVDGFFNDRMKPVIDKKTGMQKTIGDPQFVLFEKCMRGDSTDNVFSAFPGVRTKGTKNKVGLIEAYSDKDKRGYSWNNMMLQRWTDHEGVEHRVLDDYERNVTLIDLTAQPSELKAQFDIAIMDQVNHKAEGQIGINFMMFCGKYDLNKISESAASYADWMKKGYT